MSGISLSIRVGGEGRARLGELLDRIENKDDFFVAASLMMRDQTMDRFNEQRGPDGTSWVALSPVTVARRGSASPILQHTGSFREQISPQPEADRAVVTTGAFPQAAILQFGGKAGRGHKVEIPARPYLGFGDDDERDLVELAESMLFS